MLPKQACREATAHVCRLSVGNWENNFSIRQNLTAAPVTVWVILPQQAAAAQGGAPELTSTLVVYSWA